MTTSSPAAPVSTPPTSAGTARSGKISANPTLRALLVIVFFTYIAQNMLNVSIAPLSRALGLVEWAIGLAVSLAALFVAMLSQFWGRRSTHWGRRSVLLISLTLAFAAGALFVAAVWAKAIGLIGAVAATAAIVLARGPFFGSAVSAIPPTAQALIAEITPNEQARVRGMSAFSGATNLSIMIGSLVSASLGAWWIYAPVYATPWLVAAALLVAFFAIPVTASRKDHPLPPKMRWTDRRVLPWILSGMGLFFANGVLQIIVGFVVQDRLHLDPQKALTVTGGLLLASAAGAMIAQLIVVPRLLWPPRRLVRVGLSAALVMFALIALVDSMVVISVASFFMGFASGMLGPGYTAGGSLAVGPDEQGAVAGVLHAVGAVTWIFAPVTATALYGWHPIAPFALAGVFLLISTVVSYVHPLLRARRG
ncbi:MFS transporter [Schaalia sp. Marseille-Q2122]|uniref:MFS transporter n=1 Tax=Schaalia sp. Marseille-Q2122 TaxID=2736604 RepID=UPI001589B398|nr:MFS transporter [Schaalia sp. Marseille-Q2122]